MSLPTYEEATSTKQDIPLSSRLHDLVASSPNQTTSTLRRRGLSKDATRLANVLLFALVQDYGVRLSFSQDFRCRISTLSVLKLQFAVAKARGLRVPSSTGYERYNFAPIINRVHAAATELQIPIWAVEDLLLEGYRAHVRDDTRERNGGMEDAE